MAVFDPLPAAACLLDPEMASTLLAPEMASLMHSAKSFIVHQADSAMNHLLKLVLRQLQILTWMHLDLQL